MTRAHYHLSGTTYMRDFRVAAHLYQLMLHSLNTGWRCYPSLTFDICNCPDTEQALERDAAKYGNEYEYWQRRGLLA